MTIPLQHSDLIRVGEVASKDKLAILASGRRRYVEESIFFGQSSASNRGTCDDPASVPRFTSHTLEDDKENQYGAAHSVRAMCDVDRSW